MDEKAREAIEREFLKRFSNGACRQCGQKPPNELAAFERAVWYAKHGHEQETKPD